MAPPSPTISGWTSSQNVNCWIAATHMRGTSRKSSGRLPLRRRPATWRPKITSAVTARWDTMAGTSSWDDAR